MAERERRAERAQLRWRWNKMMRGTFTEKWYQLVFWCGLCSHLNKLEIRKICTVLSWTHRNCFMGLWDHHVIKKMTEFGKNKSGKCCQLWYCFPRKSKGLKGTQITGSQLGKQSLHSWAGLVLLYEYVQERCRTNHLKNIPFCRCFNVFENTSLRKCRRFITTSASEASCVQQALVRRWNTMQKAHLCIIHQWAC